MAHQPLVLASSSPRRHMLLSLTGIPFEVDIADVDEQVSGEPQQVVEMLARRKAEAVASRHPQAVIIGADTLVYRDRVLGKPKDRAEACQMLRHLAGQWHEVYSGICCLYPAQGRVLTHVECTRVHMAPMNDDEIKRYVATGEPMDKAGAYAIQGIAGMFIKAIAGCPTNVIGLPMNALRSLLAQFDMAL